MGSEALPLRRYGIYRNLPTFDPAIKDLNAIICGASGVSGFNALRALLDTPRWSKVYTLARKPIPKEMLDLLRPEQQSRIEHVCVDLLSSGGNVAESLRAANVTADYAFFYAYTEPKHKEGEARWSDGDSLTKVNGPLFQNFLDALPLANIKPRRILLQTGGKQYGLHIGRPRAPMVETDPRVDLEPNFYYAQEDALFQFCKDHPETSWNVVRPNVVIGASSNSQTDGFGSFATYAVVQAHKGEPLEFGGDFDSWQYECYHSSARMTGFLSEWAVLEDKCQAQAFNTQDGGPLSWDRFFEELARWFGVTKGVRHPDGSESDFTTISKGGGKSNPLGYGPPLDLQLKYSLHEWCQRPENKKAWESVMQNSNGQVTWNPFASENAEQYFYGDFGYMRFGSSSFNKARRFGFTGFVDTMESVFEMYSETAKLGFIPPMQVDAANPVGC